MARSKSAVLSPADKKAVVTDIKARIKDATGHAKVSAQAITVSEKVHAATVKQAQKIHEAITKEHGKLKAAALKAVEKLTAELAAIQPTVGS